ncbi:hypothetical protein GCM10018793_69660 [Streptomyces sulfonofaciens]|uniref:Carrier domain-containing protein n=1 Tax=Streptomyces sulfonofaciens TaxID=68272 RepID=A0A919GRL0_9ACTN|nr:non-ribosomal peptide synthetase [Streptomyces sulfonofaciens]GHH88756.1 hypothetical protein GCM10018793_69660 [Streptomyces sulfonofaciens]
MQSTVVGLIAEQVRQRPDDRAMLSFDGELTYTELHTRANRVADCLLRAGLAPGDAVLVRLPRGLALGVAVLAVLRADGAMCVVDTGYPRDRVRRMSQRSGARFVLTTRDLATDQVTGPSAQTPRVLVMDEDGGVTTAAGGEGAAGDTPPAVAPSREAGAEDIGYVVFTSGSTGEPKAISMPRRALDNIIGWTLRTTSAEPLRTLMYAPLGFDVFVQEVFTTWSSGGCLVVPAEERRGDLTHILDLLVEQRIERLFVPPVALARLADLACAFDRLPTSLVHVAAAGEALHITDQVREFFRRIPGCRLHNHYGPSETHVALGHTLTGPPRTWPDRPAIGVPVSGMQAHVRLPDAPEEPAGAKGELWLSGVGLAHGYRGQEELTAERFRPLPTDDGPVRMYRTGDLVERDDDGLLHFAGRLDDQVKIRGYRVEPAEVETVIRRHPAVRECAVVAWAPQPDSERQLVAHVVGAPGQPVEPHDLRAHAAGELPHYMVPQRIVVAETLPLSPNGKVDRRRLAALGGPAATAAPAGSVPVRPSVAGPGDGSAGEGVRAGVAAIWASVLGADVSTPEADFLEMGGTSLAAAVVITRVHAQFKVKVEMNEFFRAPTLGALSALVAERVTV